MRLTAVVFVSIILAAGGALAAEDAARGGEPVSDGPADNGIDSFTGLARVVATHDAPVDRPAGLGWDGSSLWMVSDQDQTIYKLDPATMAVLDSFPTPTASWSFGLDHDGVDLWGDVDDPQLVYRLDDSTGAVLNSFASPFAAPNGVAHDGAMIWHSAFSMDLALMNPSTGATVRTIPAPGNGNPRGLEFIDGSLWVVDANTYPDDAIYRLDPSDGSVLGAYIPAGAAFGLIYGLAHDGTRFWLSDLDTAKIHTVELEDGLVFYDGFESGDGLMWSGAGLLCGSTPPPPGVVCPPECTGGCTTAGTCVIDCSGAWACSGTSIICPDGFDCDVTCLGTDACRLALVLCPAAQACTVECSGVQACQWMVVESSWLGTFDVSCGIEFDACDAATVRCGHNSCQAVCAGASYPVLDCEGSCDCVTCN